MKRLLINSAAVLSAALSLAILILWIRSYSRCDMLLTQRGPRDRCGITSEFGLIVLEFEQQQRSTIQPGWQYFPAQLPRRWQRPSGILGFNFYSGEVRHFVLLPPASLRGATVPHWFFFILATTPMGIWAMHRQRTRLERFRQRSGCCVACGYDLRGSGAKCSECGTLTNYSTVDNAFTRA